MRKQQKRIIGIIILLAIASFLIFQYLPERLPFAVVTPPGQFIPNPTDSGSPYSLITQNSSYTCNTDNCIVSGSIQVTKSNTNPQIVFRTSASTPDYKDGWIAIDMGGSVLTGFKYTSSYGSGSSPLDACRNSQSYNNIKTPEGYKVILSSGSFYVCTLTSSGVYNYARKYSSSPDSSVIVTKSPQVSFAGKETTDVQADYSATFNFCPSTDSNFPFCNGVSNFVSSPISFIKYIDEVLLIRGASVSFMPKNSDGSDILDKFIRVKLYDNSCAPLIAKGDGSACDSARQDIVYCKPIINQCPIGYTLFNPSLSRVWCSNSFRGKSSYSIFSSGNPICHETNDRSSEWSKCTEPINNNTIYASCTTTKKVNLATCNAFDLVNLKSATPPQQCYLTSGQQGVEGIGTINCTNSCAIGTKTGISGATEYQECVLQNNCGILVSKTCLGDSQGQLIWDGTQKTCVLPSVNSCIPQTKLCTDLSSIKSCNPITIAGISGYQWGNPTPCLGELKCNDKGTTIPDDSCDCSGVTTFFVKDIRCKDSIFYLNYAQNGENTCWKYRDLGGKVLDTTTQECRDDEIQQRLDIGCAFPSSPASYQCTSLVDSRGIKLENCVNNICVLTSDQYTASQTQFANGYLKCDGNNLLYVKDYQDGTKHIYRWEVKSACSGDSFCLPSGNSASCKSCSKLTDSRGTLVEQRSGTSCILTQDVYSATATNLANSDQKCFGNVIYGAFKYTNGSNNYYRWEIKTDAPNSVNGLCSSGFTCSEEISLKANCTPGFSQVGIFAPDSLSVNTPLNNIKIQVTNKVPSYQNTPIYASVLENGVEVSGNGYTRVSGNVFTDNNGIAYLNLGYASPRSTNLTIEVFVGSPTSIYTTTKEVIVAKKLIVKLNCPVSSIVNRQVTCTYSFADADFPTVPLIGININRVVLVTDGAGREIVSTLTGNSIFFTPSTLGSITVSVTGKAEGFLPTTDSPSTMTINPITYTPQIFLGGDPLDKYASTGITTGGQSISIVVDESGNQAEIFSINAEMVSPTQSINQGTLLNFVKQTGGFAVAGGTTKWVAQYNFATPGQTYTLHIISIDFVDRTKQPLTELTYKVATIATPPIDVWQTKLFLYIGIAIAILFIIGIIVLAIVLRKRR